MRQGLIRPSTYNYLKQMNDNKKLISFEQALESDINYITDKTLQLHLFETQQQDNNLKVNERFETCISAWLSAELSQANSLLFIIFVDKNKIGFAFIKILPSQNDFTDHSIYGLIQSIWVEPEYRNNSYGEQVIKLIESIFEQQQVGYYEVSYTMGNQTARNFWSKCGLVETSITARKFL
jgi:predicted acetyltransferase